MSKYAAYVENDKILQVFMFTLPRNVQRSEIPYLRLVAGLSPWRTRFSTKSILVGFVVDKLSDVFPPDFWLLLSLSCHQCSTLVYQRRLTILEADNIVN